MTNYLVTGCAGFIGWKVTETLLNRGDSVIGIDQLNSAYSPELKQWRLQQLQTNLPQTSQQFQFHCLDLSDQAELDEFLKTIDLKTIDAQIAPINAVIHLAARAGIRASIHHPDLFYQSNVLGTLHLLEACVRRQIPKFVFASSSSVYGPNNTIPFCESATTDFPISPYAATKKAAEVLTYHYHYQHQLDVSILRFFTVYGPAGRPDMSIYRFIEKILNQQPIEIYGTGKQRRDFTFIEDIVDGILAAVQPVGYEIFNLGGDHPYSLEEVISIIEHHTSLKAKRHYGPANQVDLPETWANIEKAKQILNWQPKTSLEQGLLKTINWHQAHREMKL